MQVICDCLFSATGVTDGVMLRGVKFRKNIIETETVVMRQLRPVLCSCYGYDQPRGRLAVLGGAPMPTTPSASGKLGQGDPRSQHQN